MVGIAQFLLCHINFWNFRYKSNFSRVERAQFILIIYCQLLNRQLMTPAPICFLLVFFSLSNFCIHSFYFFVSSVALAYTEKEIISIKMHAKQIIYHLYLIYIWLLPCTFLHDAIHNSHI